MIIETLADINDQVYFISENKIKIDLVESIDISITFNIDSIPVINIKYSLMNYPSKLENEIGLTQEGLFEKIKYIEDEAKYNRTGK